MKNINYLLTIVGLLTLGLGSSAFATLGSLPKLSPEELEQRLAQYNYEAQVSVKQTRPRVDDKQIEKFTVELNYQERVAQLHRNIKLDIYQPVQHMNRKLPLVFVFPPIRGLSQIDAGFAQFFAEQGFVAVVSYVMKDVEEFQDMATLFDEFTHSIIDKRVAIDHLSSWPHVDAQRIGALGVSLGGIRAGILHGIEPRVKATYMIVGGGNIPGIMIQSQQKTVMDLKSKFMNKYKFRHPNEYEMALRAGMAWDPVWTSQTRNSDGLYMVIGGKDIKVHTQYQKELASNFKNIASSTVNLSHEATAGFVFFNRKSVADFFKNKLR